MDSLLRQELDGGHGGGGAVGTGGGQLADGLGPAVSGCKDAGHSGPAVLAGRQEALLIQRKEGSGQGGLGLLAHSLEQAGDRQFRDLAGDQMPQPQTGQGLSLIHI